MERIYHNYKKWECYKNGFYDNVSVKNKDFLISKVIELFTNSDLTEIYMRKVINDWYFSCEHNLTNSSLNKIAYIGQSACCIYTKAPFHITMSAWNKVDLYYRNIADKIALKIIKEWEQNHKLKNILKSGNGKDMNQEYQMKLQMN